MNATILLYVEERKRPGQPAPEFSVRPLFFPSPRRQGELLSRAMSKLVGDLRKQLEDLGRSMRHEELADWCFAPDVTEHRFSARLDLRRSAPVCKTLLVTFTAIGRTIAFPAMLPDLWFDVTSGQSLDARATDVLTAHFRQQERELEIDAVVPPEMVDPPRAWITGVELDFHPSQQPPKPPPPFMALGGGGEVVSGRRELEKVGRCLDWLFPDDLDRAILREPEVMELGRLLDDHDRRPVLLVGPRAVGKSALIHEYVYRRVEKRGSPYARKQNVWLLSPQRLISGMSYVGQWENRLLAILREAQKRQHVLYFDDLLGLYLSGLTSNSDLSVAQVLRPFIERRDVRVLAEVTPEALGVLRERDRGLADLFHILPVNEPPPREVLRILIEVMRQAEGHHRCTFDPAVIPAVIDLQQRYVRDLSMPGKAARFLRQLAAKYRDKHVTRDAVLDEFAARSGLSVTFLDRRRRLARTDVVDALARTPHGVTGQPAAVGAMADVVGVAKARLNDPARPLAAFLFLGPTGVGKTQAAKALAAYLFGDADRLVRFDMNEYVDPGSPARLVGTFFQPEGLLTSAVRRQPFCVILLDEIEKADPGVFDLLLLVLGEGRLTDSLGRTADFGNAIVILTSNLGAREAATSFGLRPVDAGDAAAAYVAAAERFFRPEFYNRLDRIIPFRPLARDDIRDIAAGLIRGVFDRDGLRQRKCVLRVDPLAMERVVDQGFHPQLGARALKRAIERQLTAPVAAALAALDHRTPTVISIYPGRDGIVTHTQGLIGVGEASQTASATVAPQRHPCSAVDLDDPEDVLERIEAALDRAQAASGLAPPAGALMQGQIRPEHFRYLAVREQADRVQRMLDRAFERLNAPVRRSVLTGHAMRRVPKRESQIFGLDSTDHALFRALVAAEEVNQYVLDLTKSLVPFGARAEDQFRQLLHEAALLEAMTDGQCADRALIHLRPIAEGAAFGPEVSSPQETLRAAYEQLFEGRYGFTCAPLPVATDANGIGRDEWLLLEMPGAYAVARVEEGTHLFLPADGRTWPVQVRVAPLRPDEDPAAAVHAHREARARWRSALIDGTAEPQDDPWTLRPVVRVYEGSGGRSSAVDLRSGLIATGMVPTAADVRMFVMSQLPLPAEVLA